MTPLFYAVAWMVVTVPGIGGGTNVIPMTSLELCHAEAQNIRENGRLIAFCIKGMDNK